MTPDEARELFTSARVARLATAGADRAVHWLPAAQRGPVEDALERFEGAVAELRGK